MTPEAYLQSLGASRIFLGLDRIRLVLAHLGNPQNKFPSAHLAGSNGKGSVAAMMDSGLRGAGLKVALYMSPHLIHVRERFQINRQPITSSRFAALVQFLRKQLNSPALKGVHLTQFEFLTVIAFLWFAEENVDIALIETGLGGRLDATNVLSRVFVSVITTISKEHTDWLGDTIRKIAAEKAGIIKPYVPVVTGTKGEARDVILKRAKTLGAPVFFSRTERLGSLTMKGPHQRFNADMAFKALNVLSDIMGPFKESELKKGIQAASWPGRFEEIHLKGWRSKIILDGAHNSSAMKALIQTLRKEGLARVNVLFGALKDKKCREMASLLAPMVKQGRAVGVASDRSEDPFKLAQFSFWKGKVVGASSPALAWKWAQSLKKEPTPLLVTGSLYLVGDIRGRILRLQRRNGVKIQLS